ncbi:MAG: aldose epimerase family protein [Planctomycetota bacterium]
MQRELFGTTPDGHDVHRYTFSAGGVTLRVINLGGVVTEIHTPDRDGNTADVNLGYDTLPPYQKRHPYFGALVGRIAGRLTDGKFDLDGKSYQLGLNEPGEISHIHGGHDGFDQRLWTAEPIDDATLKLTLHSPDGDQGYPGNLDIAVTYKLTDDGAWTIEYSATTDAPTLVNPTNHAYFNLAGHDSGSIHDHVLQVHATENSPARADSVLTGAKHSVDGTVDDMREPVHLADRIDQLDQQHGSMYFVSGEPGTLRPAARLTHPATGRSMDVETTESMLQVYTGRNLDGNDIGKGGKPYSQFGGICLEAHGYPDGIHHPHLGDTVLRPGETYRQTTVYRFGTDG